MPRPHRPIVPSDRTALAALLSRHYSSSYRIAAALSGSPRVAGQVTRDVLRQALRVRDSWETDSDIARWFAHHTVLLVRQAITDCRPDPAGDGLLPLTADPIFTTILRTLRFIPPQQREAFLLHHGEGFDLRQLATAMDCSSEAAANHLVAATQALRPVAVDRLGAFTEALPGLLARLLPPPEVIAIESARQTARYLWPRRLGRWIGWPVLLLALAVMGYFAWRFWRMLAI